MGFLGFLPLMFAVVTSAAHKPQCHQLFGKGGCSESRRNNQCPPTVLNNIDTGGSGVERLVIFLYKKIDTGELISFIPEKQYQHKILDYPEEESNIYEISEEITVKELYESSPSKEIREKDEKCKHVEQPANEAITNEESNEVVIVVDTQSTGGQLFNKDTAPESSQMEPNKIKKSESWHLPVNNDSEQNKQNPSQRDKPREINPLPEYIPGSNDNYASEALNDNIQDYEYTIYNNTQHSTENELPNYVIPDNTDNQHSNEQDSEKPVVGDEYPLESNDTPNTQETQENANDDHNDYDKKSLKRFLGSTYPPNLDQPKEYYERHTTVEEAERDNGEKSPEPREENMETYSYIEKSTDNPQGDNEGLVNIRPKQHVRVPVYSHGKLIGWTTHTVTHKKTYWQSPVIDSSYYVPGTNLLPYNRVEHEYIPSFGYWLHRQLDIITINDNKIPTSPDDIHVLQKEIRNILLQNGYMVTRQGLLSDGHGTVTSLENLKLRPILVGKSLSNKQFSKHSRSDIQLTIPSNTPFLEGLLVTMVNPPKVLGIVPLSITSLPQKMGSGQNQNKDEITIKGHVEPVGQKSLLTVLPLSELVSFRKGTKFTGKRLLIPSFRGDRNENDSKQLRKALADVMKKAKKKEEEEANIKKPEEKDKSEEVPDYRIIGGSSATFSGTPILNRGRSGGYATRIGYIY